METERPRMTRSRSKSQSRAVAAAEAGDDAAPSGPNVNGEVGGTFADEIDAPKRQGDADEKVDGIERVEDEEDKADDVRADRDKEEKVDKESDVTEEVDTSKDSPETLKKDTENVAAEPNEEKPDKDLNGSQKQPSEAPETPPATLGRGRRSRILNSVHGSTEDSEKSGESIKAATETKPKPRGRKRKVTEVPEAETGEKDVTDSKEKDEEEASSQGTEEHNESKKAESIEGSMDPDLDLPPKQTLGKGKRARIPNRKYGDIPVTVTPKSTVTENGSEKLKSDSESLDFSSHEETSAGYTTGMLSLSPSGNTPQSKKQKITNLKDPKYLKPFEYGWKRELVFRGTSDSKLKRNADVYYFSPDKKKVRSMREVVENLKTKMLSVDNFTFFKEAIGLNDPEKEIIRSAAKRTNTPTLPDKEVAHKAEPLPKGRKAKSPSQKAMSPQVSTQKVTSPKLNLIDEETPELKVKLPTKKSAKRVEKDEETTEAVTTPSKGPSTKTPAKAAKSRSAKRARLSVTAASAPTSVEEKSSSSQPVNHFQNLAYGYSTLLQVFQYLKVQDLLRAGCVCTMWRDVMSNPTLWRTVRMKNSQVHSFEGLANMLKKHCTKHLDLRKVLLPNGGDEIWPEFSKAIEKVDTLRRIELCRCPASVVEKLAVSNPQLEVLNAVTIKCETLDLTPFKSLTEVKELRLKSTTGFTVSSNLDSLKEMKSLVHLSLTSVKELDKMNLSTIAELTELESLDLGECTDFPKEFGEKILVKLTKLEKLRLEKGQGNCYTFEILEAVRSMPRLEQLELVNFDIKAGFDKALGACQNIKKLLLIPTYISQSATTNHMLLGGVVRLQHSLTHFVWGVTLELLRVTELFIDQCEEMEKKERKEVKSGGGAGDFIPVLKPTPLIREKDAEIPPAYDPPQVEIFHLTRLQKLLMMNLPTTRVKILKIPFHATWRQSITDSVN